MQDMQIILRGPPPAVTMDTENGDMHMVADMSDSQSPQPHNNNGSDTPSATLTLRMIMQGKEVGSIIGKKGDNVKKFREESGAKINISDSSCPERIVTVTGTTDAIFKAYTMICKKFEENSPNPGVPRPPVTIRLIVPASQCGSLIGKGGSKIKEIREVTGASVQVASEMLPNSTERTVTISGAADAITQCIYHICCVMLESPPKGATIPYRPKPAMPPVIFAGGQAFTVQGQYAIPSPEQQAAQQTGAQVSPQGLMSRGGGHWGATNGLVPALLPQQPQGTYARAGMFPYPATPQFTKMALQQGLLQPGALPFLTSQPGLMPGMQSPGMNTMAMTAGGLAQFGRQQAQPTNTQTHEMTIPNDLIGCIIGRGGAKINEIRQLSGATIKIANADEGSSDRKVTIMGSPETINAAQYLINASIEMHKNLTLDTSTPTSTSLTSNPNPLAIPLNQLVKPLPLMGLNMGIFDSAANRKTLTTKMRGGNSPEYALASAKKTERTKFAPY